MPTNVSCKLRFQRLCATWVAIGYCCLTLIVPFHQHRHAKSGSSAVSTTQPQQHEQATPGYPPRRRWFTVPLANGKPLLVARLPLTLPLSRKPRSLRQYQRRMCVQFAPFRSHPRLVGRHWPNVVAPRIRLVFASIVLPER